MARQNKGLGASWFQHGVGATSTKSSKLRPLSNPLTSPAPVKPKTTKWNVLEAGYPFLRVKHILKGLKKHENFKKKGANCQQNKLWMQEQNMRIEILPHIKIQISESWRWQFPMSFIARYLSVQDAKQKCKFWCLKCCFRKTSGRDSLHKQKDSLSI